MTGDRILERERLQGKTGGDTDTVEKEDLYRGWVGRRGTSLGWGGEDGRREGFRREYLRWKY